MGLLTKMSIPLLLVILPASANTQTVTVEDITPKQEYQFDLPSGSTMANPAGMERFREMAAEIGRESAETTMREMARISKELGIEQNEPNTAEALAAAPGEALLPQGHRATILVSASLGENTLKDMLARFQMRKDVRLAFRGVPAHMTVPEFAYWLSQLTENNGNPIQDLNIVIDPEIFDLVGATMAPTTVIENLNETGLSSDLDLGRVIARGEGSSDPDWQHDQFLKGEADTRNPNVVEIEEEDLRIRAQREASQVASKLTTDPDELKGRYWDRIGHETHMLMIRPAGVDRTRQLHFMFRTDADIKDNNGSVIAYAGEVFQPKDVQPFDRRIFVLNPNIEAEVEHLEEAMATPRTGVARTMIIVTELPKTKPGQEPWDGLQALIDRFKVQVFVLNDHFKTSFKIEHTPTEIYPETLGGHVEVMSYEKALK